MSWWWRCCVWSGWMWQGLWAGVVCASMAWSCCRGATPLLLDLVVVSTAAAWVCRRPRPPPSDRAAAPSRCIAHRGAALDAPENTLAAFKYSVEKRCKHIEFDLRITKDGKCVLSHDATVVGRKIADSDWSDIKDIDVGKGHPMREKFGITNLCLLEDALEFFSTNKVKMIIDVKEMDTRIYTAVVDAFVKYPEMYDTTIVTSFNPVIMYKIRLMNPRIVGSLNYRPRCFSSVSYSAIGAFRKRFPDSILKHLGARILDELYSIVWSTRILAYFTGSSSVILHKDIASLSVVEDWRKAGYSVFLWGVNQPVEKQYVLKILGVPYIADTLIGEPTTIGEMNGKSH
ncbi:glycerophosphodiester phosphodiesterase 1 isoform X2 [Arctopsyche grandis]|uniref:glycerophosphodiester phosphodiesterase 1 isoform X2 n=1 Tax=Arctopsyche grandis TaxID=121162 RepID=UPI00406D9E42